MQNNFLFYILKTDNMNTRKLFLGLMFMLLSTIIIAQKPINYTEVVAVDSTMSSKELFSKALNFITLNFKSANDVIQLKDEDNGKIICKGNTRFINNRPEYVDGVINFTLQISVKKGKYKYDFSNFVHEAFDRPYSFGLLYDSNECSVPAIDNMNSFVRPISWKNGKAKSFALMKEEIKDLVYTMAKSLKEDMSKKSSIDNW